ncbi:hypothetical protein ABS642_05160 [Microbacterium sp. A8/3-1]|uniref:Uncharacterized protein n=1 Tax=Microbacterium sp. A8/3-1 TaxID=3160749 RepID=A0AAU7W119_9MICO
MDLVALYLDGEGISSTAKRTPARLSDSLIDDVAIAPDLSIPGVHLDVTSRLSPYRLSEDLESAQRAAAINRTPVAGFVQWRGDKEIENSYVVLDLQSFARLARGDHLAPP